MYVNRPGPTVLRELQDLVRRFTNDLDPDQEQIFRISLQIFALLHQNCFRINYPCVYAPLIFFYIVSLNIFFVYSSAYQMRISNYKSSFLHFIVLRTSVVLWGWWWRQHSVEVLCALATMLVTHSVLGFLLSL